MHTLLSKSLLLVFAILILCPFVSYGKANLVIHAGDYIILAADGYLPDENDTLIPGFSNDNYSKIIVITDSIAALISGYSLWDEMHFKNIIECFVDTLGIRKNTPITVDSVANAFLKFYKSIYNGRMFESKVNIWFAGISADGSPDLYWFTNEPDLNIKKHQGGIYFSNSPLMQRIIYGIDFKLNDELKELLSSKIDSNQIQNITGLYDSLLRDQRLSYFLTYLAPRDLIEIAFSLSKACNIFDKGLARKVKNDIYFEDNNAWPENRPIVICLISNEGISWFKSTAYKEDQQLKYIREYYNKHK